MSKKLKLSPWHDGSVKPVHVGVYEVQPDDDGTKYFSFFDGKKWNDHWFTVKRAFEKNNRPFALDCTEKWRGVMK